MTRAKVSTVTPAFVINLAIMVLSVGTSYGIIATRVSTLENNFIQYQTRFEREVVPRAEHIQMNNVLEQRLVSIVESQIENRRQMEQMQLKIDELLRKK